MLWFIFPIDTTISWEGHGGGFLAGLTICCIHQVPIQNIKKDRWEKDDFNEEEDEFLQTLRRKTCNFIEKKSGRNY